MVRVGRTWRPVCASAGASAGFAPATRYVLPSIRTSEKSVCGFPVQWRVSASFNRSLNDQTLKYGSDATSGTAGGRKAAVAGGSAACEGGEAMHAKNRKTGIGMAAFMSPFLIWKIFEPGAPRNGNRWTRSVQ